MGNGAGLADLMQEMKLSQKSRSNDHKPDSRRSGASRPGKHRSTVNAQRSEDAAEAIVIAKGNCQQSPSRPEPPSPESKEEHRLGTEGWLGLMIFLGVVLGLVYARLTLP
jgi:hypothetical protein